MAGIFVEQKPCPLLLDHKVRWSFDQVQEVPLAVLKEQDLPSACGWSFRLRKLDSTLFKLGSGCGQRIHAQCDVTKAGEFIIPSVLGHTVGSINFEPAAAGQSDQKGGRLLAIVKNLARAKDALVPRFQPDRIRRRNGDVFDGNVHRKIKIQSRTVRNQNRIAPLKLRSSVTSVRSDIFLATTIPDVDANHPLSIA